MRQNTLIFRSLRHHAATHAAVAAGVFVATAVLTGALLVGDSMRGSLRATALERLAGVECVATAPRYFREQVAGEFAPAIQIAAAISNAESGERCNHGTVFGVTDAFWARAGANCPAGFDDLSIVVNRALADELDVAAGRDVVLRFATPREIPLETLMGRRDELTRSVRLRVAGVVEDQPAGNLSLTPSTAPPANGFMTLAGLQRALGKPGAANLLLSFHADDAALTADTLAGRWTLADFGLRLRTDADRGYVALESETMLIPPAVEEPAARAARQTDAELVRLVSYLANDITVGDGDESRTVPYSIVTAIDDAWYTLAKVRSAEGAAARSPRAGEILLNQWAADELHPAPGQYVHLRYFQPADFASLTELAARFSFGGALAMGPPTSDPGFTPEYPGLTDADNMTDWDPPIPVDLKRVRQQDENYWHEYRTAPKAFIRLDEGLRLWSERDSRFGRFTSIRFYPRPAESLDEFAARLESTLMREIEPAALGFVVRDVRREALAAGAGSTDFGGLFIGFSLFLIAAAAMLVGLLFRLGALRRAGEAGLLLATGFAARTVIRLWLIEALLVATLGCALGLAGACVYAKAMLHGLATWWSAAANAPALSLYVQPTSILIGFAASLLLAAATIGLSVRGLAKIPARALLAGEVEIQGVRRGASRFTTWIIGTSVVAAIALVAYGVRLGGIARAGAFFGGGAFALTGLLAAFRILLGMPWRAARRPGLRAWLRTGARNAVRNPSRSTLTAALIASASFIVAAISAFHLAGDDPPLDRQGSYGGYSLMIESTSPVPFDLRTPEGRESAGVSGEDANELARTPLAAFRLRGGAAVGCTNPYAKREPRILGASPESIERGGFVFAESAAESGAERANPWRLLNRRFEDGAIPVIGDQAAVQWQLHSGLGKMIDVAADDGRPVRLRFVGLLANSPLQDELIIAESDFRAFFPSVSGYAFFLASAPLDRLSEVRRAAEHGLSDFGADATDLRTRLAGYLAVQNTYLRTFQALGGLGLLLGTIGLAAALLRNVWERRGELALLRAIGFSNTATATVVISENLLITVAGLGAGLLAAVVALLPSLLGPTQSSPWRSIALLAAAVPVVALGSSVIAVCTTIRTPLLGALRRE